MPADPQPPSDRDEVTAAGSPGRRSIALPVARGAGARFGASVLVAGLGLLTAAVVARRLGPEGKGLVGSISYLAAAFAPVAALGMGEAGLSLVARNRAALRTATANSLALLSMTLPLAAAALVASISALVGSAGPIPTALAIVLLTANTLNGVLALLHESQHRLGFTSAVRAVSAGSTCMATVALVGIGSGGPSSAFLSIALGGLVGTGSLVLALARAGDLGRPSLETEYLREAIRIGLQVQAATVCLVLAMRADLLAVQALLGTAPAGLYSVSLTLGGLAVFAPAALSASSAPKMAQLSESDFRLALRHLVRQALFAATAVVAPLIFAAPVALPAVFGDSFQDAVPAAMILAGAALPYSAQLVICRARAAHGQPETMRRSYAASLGVMLSLDWLLIPRLGITGAAVASLGAAVAGLLVALAPGWGAARFARTRREGTP